MPVFILATVLLLFTLLSQAQVGIGTTSPHASAQLEVRSTNKGLLLPSIALTGTTDATTIVSPAPGLLVYNTASTGSSPTNVTPGFYYYNGSAWVRLIVSGDNSQVTNTMLAGNIAGTKLVGTDITTVGTITSGTWSGTTIAIEKGGTGATTATAARTNLGATTVGSNFLTLSNPSAITFPRVNADNTVSTLDAATFRSAIGAGPTLSNPITGTGTSGYLTAFASSSSVGNSALYDNAGKVGIGTTSPNTALHIQNSNSIGSGIPSNNAVPSIYLFNSNNVSSTAHTILTLQTGGASGGKPYMSFDAAGFQGYSIGMNNPNNQFIINTDWNFNTSDATKNAIVINETGQSRVVISSSAGDVAPGWPIGWGGGIATYDISCAGVYYTTLSARSDQRLKNSIQPIDDNAKERYLRLRPVSYFWNKGESGDRSKQYGLIAQEVELLFPEMISTGNDNRQTKSVNFQSLHALSLKVIQSQQNEIEHLKKQQADLALRLEKLEAKNQ